MLASGLPERLRKKALEKISEGSLMRRALISTLREIGFLETSSHGPSRDTGGLLSSYSNGGVFGRLKDIRFVLVDDHFDLGYDHVLAFILFGGSSAEGGSLTCHKNPDWLIDHLNTLSPIGDWTQPRYLFNNECDVLFLDLRLWEEQGNSLSETIKKDSQCS